ncbi:MAG: hypothetical protein ACREEM_22245 [Blastocatellia bacterium]
METANKVGLGTTARDMARFGLLVMAEGIWNGRSLLADKQQMRELLRPSPVNPNYAHLWWLNRSPRSRAGGGAPELPVPTAPGDLFYANGALERKIYIVPSQGMVVVRLGDKPSDSFDRELWRLLMASVKGSS